MSIERVRPIKQFEVVIAYGPFRVGDKIQPTGMYRDVLLRRGVIKEIKDEPAPREAEPDLNRMVPTKGQAGSGSLFTRTKRAR